jgi:hypothetical protein
MWQLFTLSGVKITVDFNMAAICYNLVKNNSEFSTCYFFTISRGKAMNYQNVRSLLPRR